MASPGTTISVSEPAARASGSISLFSNHNSHTPTGHNGFETGIPKLLRVAALQARGLAALEHIPVPERTPTVAGMKVIREKYRKTRTIRYLNLVFLFREQALLEGNIRPVSLKSIATITLGANVSLALAFRYGGTKQRNFACWLDRPKHK